MERRTSEYLRGIHELPLPMWSKIPIDGNMTDQDCTRNHRHTMRLPDYDYTTPGTYFVTVCIHGKRCILGSVTVGCMRLNEAGRIVQAVWNELPIRYPNVEIDSLVIMPNHIHGIIVLTDGAVGAIHELPLQDTRQFWMAQLDTLLLVKRRSMLLPRVVGYFKMNSAKRINQLRQTPGKPVWQRNYFEHIVRRTDKLSRIREYILNNPLRWDLDLENQDIA